MASTDEFAPRCPECGAALDSRESKCWLCLRKLTAEPEMNPYVSPPAQALAVSPAQFSLSTLLLVMTLVAVCLGVTMAAPGLGVLLIVLALPALVRTVVSGLKQKQAGAPYTPSEKIAAYCVSLMVMLMVGVAGGIAFEIACWGSGLLVIGIGGDQNLEAGLITGVALGSIAGIGVLVWLLYLTRPRKPTITHPPTPDS